MVDLWNHADQMASGQVTMLLELQNSWPMDVYPKKYGHGQVSWDRCGDGFSIARGLLQHMWEDGSIVNDSCLFSFLILSSHLLRDQTLTQKTSRCSDAKWYKLTTEYFRLSFIIIIISKHDPRQTSIIPAFCWAAVFWCTFHVWILSWKIPSSFFFDLCIFWLASQYLIMCLIFVNIPSRRDPKTSWSIHSNRVSGRF